MKLLPWQVLVVFMAQLVYPFPVQFFSMAIVASATFFAGFGPLTLFKQISA
jgi:hypothetical protein